MGTGRPTPPAASDEDTDDRPWAVVQHVGYEGPGLIADVLADRRCGVELVRLDRGDPLPDHRDVAGLVVMGGPMGVHDVDDHPWLAPERTLMGTVATDGRPVLGICLGAQQLALALGAEVTVGTAPEIGIGRVALTADGRRDPVLGPEYGGLAATAMACVHWHSDTFSLPVGAVHLAATRTTPHQAFRWGASVYGLQFHVEVDRGLAAAWGPHLPAGVTLDGPGLAEVEAVGRRVIRRFVEQAQISSPGGTPVLSRPPPG
jgi:GMP synthase (glutamine-hydrolysing)